MKAELTRQLTLDEGKKRCVYKDSLGYFTIGIGRLVDPRMQGSGLRDEEIAFMLSNDIEDRVNALMKAYPWFQDLDDARKGVLVNMPFQLGMHGLGQFKVMLECVRKENWMLAGVEMMRSAWAKQTPERAKRLARQMETGLWVYAPDGKDVE